VSPSAAKVLLLGAFVFVVAAALSSCGGRTTQQGDQAPGLGPEAGGCHGAPPSKAVREVSLAMTQVNFGDSANSAAWQTIGFDLDGTCTMSSATVACTPPGPPQAPRTEGVSGIDNSFGANICPLIDMTTGVNDCSTQVRRVYLVTDASGSGTLAIEAQYWDIEIPIADAYVTNSGGVGVLGAVTKLDDFLTVVANWQEEALVTSTEPCWMLPRYSEEPLVQAADILVGGAIDAGHACNAISIGMQFFDATPFTGPLPAVPPDACTCGLVSDGGVGCWVAETGPTDGGIE
jgi:hypothetical protein